MLLSQPVSDAGMDELRNFDYLTNEKGLLATDYDFSNRAWGYDTYGLKGADAYIIWGDHENTLKYKFGLASCVKFYNRGKFRQLGTGVVFVGRQKEIVVAEKIRKIDMLFYYIKLRCYVVIEFRAVSFEMEFAGKLNFLR